VIGAKGVYLSGGEQQGIANACVMLKMRLSSCGVALLFSEMSQNQCNFVCLWSYFLPQNADIVGEYLFYTKKTIFV
jgi:hypothetical protein